MAPKCERDEQARWKESAPPMMQGRQQKEAKSKKDLGFNTQACKA